MFHPTKFLLKLLSSPCPILQLGWSFQDANWTLPCLKPSKALPFRMKAIPLKRFTGPFLPGLDSLLAHLVIQQIFIECFLYAQQSKHGSGKGRQKSLLTWKQHMDSTEREKIISKWYVSYVWGRGKWSKEGREEYLGMVVEAAVVRRAAREGPTRKQCLSKALKEVRAGSVGLAVYLTVRTSAEGYHQHWHFSSRGKAIPHALPSGNTLLSSNSSSSFCLLLILQVWLICASHDTPEHRPLPTIVHNEAHAHAATSLPHYGEHVLWGQEPGLFEEQE